MGCDAVVFAAGSGPGVPPERKCSVDRDRAILLADAAVQAGIRRSVMVSSRRADADDADSVDIFQICLRAKSEADAALRGNDQLDWTIARPGQLTDDSPTGKVQAGAEVEGSIPRGDVAALIATLLATGAGVGAQFEVVSGETPIAEAVAAL
ncbi:hypothetical protein GCM10009792_24890 [Microcella alkalica]|uniref:NAD(P)-binding domain-containing protein n=1 Tax=Microcella alkalica TaxID=355930 RepID=A0A839E9F6_9MICO|nr:NAD(P)H-binding protein [Microcella alkalica]MBA8848127.1 hypothetical protein [Microcella alkalica]